MFVGNLYVFFGEMSIRSSAHFWIGLFVFLILSCMYILEINPLSVASFANQNNDFKYTLMRFSFSFFFLIFFASPRGMGDLSSPTPGIEAVPLQWKFGVLTTGLPGKSLK